MCQFNVGTSFFLFETFVLSKRGYGFLSKNDAVNSLEL